MGGRLLQADTADYLNHSSASDFKADDNVQGVFPDGKLVSPDCAKLHWALLSVTGPCVASKIRGKLLLRPDKLVCNP